MQTNNSSQVKSPKLSSINQKPVKANSYQFRPLRYLKLYDLYHYIKKAEVQQLNESMFPHNFSQQNQKQLATYLFEIEVEDLYKKWTIIKRLPELVELKQNLKQKFPDSPFVFSFPETQQSEINQIYAPSILQLFSAFLKSISKSEQIIKQKQWLLFIENYMSPQKKKVVTYFQRKLLKKAGGRHTQSSLSRIMNNFISWRHKFFTITTEGVYYTDDQDSFNVKQMLLFNQSFHVLHGEIKTGYTFGLILNSSHRVLQVDAQNVFCFIFFIYFLRKIMGQKQDLKTNRFNSFAKVRYQSCQSTFYIDGKDYFSAVCTELKKAKTQVFITGWIVTPHMYLAQNFQDLENRIDKVLQNLASQGVKVYIIVYNAPKIAIDINPQFTESYLSQLHPNIKVLKHPNYMFIPFLWSHHQKLVIIDQKVAFMGGLDIGYGRMDDNRHLISDQGQKTWKGIQYCNYRIKDLCQISQHEVCSIDRLTQPRMPWHDVGIKLMGLSVTDLCKHFVQYWNYANYQLYLPERELLMFTGIHQEEIESFEEIFSHEEQLTNNSNENENKIKQEEQGVSKQKQQKSPPQMSKVNLNQPENKKESIPSLGQQSQKNIHKTNQKGSGSNSFQKNKFISFIEKGSNKMYDDQPELKRLKSSQMIQESFQHTKQAQKQYYLKHLKKNADKSQIFIVHSNKQIYLDKKPPQNATQSIILKELNNTVSSSPNISTFEVNKSKQTHQILRSASLWSLGIQEGKQEKSILQAYIELIENSKYFIYIENQFLMSTQNQVANKIVERIIKAVQNKENFKIVIVIPFLPGFSGQIQDEASAVFRVQLDLMYKTICRGENSILSQLQGIGNLEDYLAIYCPRTHGLVSGMPFTEIVYVHSKVMIVDDEVALIGSANINDRSLMGDRDSQIAIVVEDSQEIEISNESLDLPKLKVKKFAHELRKQLYMEHFTLSSQEAEHYLNYHVWDKMMFNAQRNQKIYRKLFGCYPDDCIQSFSDIQKIRDEAEPQRYEELKILIKGYACPFQREFLCNQSLQLHSGQKEYYIPFINFT